MIEWKAKGFDLVIGATFPLPLGEHIESLGFGAFRAVKRATRQDYIVNSNGVEALSVHAPFYYQIELTEQRANAENPSPETTPERSANIQ